MKPHKNAEFIKAWADGAEIQTRIGITWVDFLHPDWIGSVEYRIKPAYPETTMSNRQLYDAYIAPTSIDSDQAQRDGWRRIANAALRHAIDTGIVAPKEVYEQCAADLRRAEDTLKRLGYQDCGGELWKPPLGVPPQWARQR